MAYSDNFVADVLSLVGDIVSGEFLNASNLLFEDAFQYSDLASEHEVITGVRHGSKMPILDDNANPETFPFVDETSCTATECDVTNEYSAHDWEIKLIECRVPICLRSFNENFLKFWNTWRQTQEGEPNMREAMIDFMLRKFNKNHVLGTWRSAYFADSSSASAYLNGYDGIFVQAEANPDQVIQITENYAGSGSGSACSSADQAITGEAVNEYLVQMYEKAMEQAWFSDMNGLEYKITRSMATKWIAWLNRQETKVPHNCECIDPATQTAMRSFSLAGNLFFNGIPVKVRHEWDDIIAGLSVLNGGGPAFCSEKPHRAILAKRSNLLIGTSETNALASFDMWYEKKDKKIYIEGSSYIGSGIPLKSQYVVAI